MCGRFTQAYSWSEVHAFLDLTGPARNLRPRYNIAPTTTIDVARLGEGGRELVPMRWGLTPSWWKKPLNELPSSFQCSCRDGRRKGDVPLRLQVAPLHHSGVRFLRMDGTEGRAHAALFFVAVW